MTAYSRRRTGSSRELSAARSGFCGTLMPGF
jgi:hypothetical protein